MTVDSQREIRRHKCCYSLKKKIKSLSQHARNQIFSNIAPLQLATSISIRLPILTHCPSSCSSAITKNQCHRSHLFWGWLVPLPLPCWSCQLLSASAPILKRVPSLAYLLSHAWSSSQFLVMPLKFSLPNQISCWGRRGISETFNLKTHFSSSLWKKLVFSLTLQTQKLSELYPGRSHLTRHQITQPQHSDNRNDEGKAHYPPPTPFPHVRSTEEKQKTTRLCWIPKDTGISPVSQTPVRDTAM